MTPRQRAALAAGVLCLPAAARGGEAAPERMLDAFDDAAAWHVIASDDVRASLRAAPASAGRGLCLDFDFGKVSGYAGLRRDLPIDYPANYEFAFDVRGTAPAATLQFKLTDASGDNVWWATQPAYAFPRDWRRMKLGKRRIAFAWGPAASGPAAGRELRHSARLELVVARSGPGNKGSVCFDRLGLHELPAEAAGPVAAASASASSSLPGSPAMQAVDAMADTAWRSDPSAGPAQALTVDLGQPREFDMLELHWLPGQHASRYFVDLSADGRQWRTWLRVRDGNGGGDPRLLQHAEARFVRMRLQSGPGGAYALSEVELRQLAPDGAANAFFGDLAKDAPRGRYPRGFTGSQGYWTVLGIDGGGTQGLLSEDGALEFAPGSASLEPFLVTHEGIASWADVETTQSLQDGYLPIPSVTWVRGELALRITAFAAGTPRRAQILARYTLENRSGEARDATLALAVRPFQVNPPAQFLNLPGGVSPIRSLSWKTKAVSVNGKRRLHALQAPDAFVATDFAAGDIDRLLAETPGVRDRSNGDGSGFASGALLYRLRLPAHGSRSIGIVVPLAGAPDLPSEHPDAWLQREQARVAAAWRKKLNAVVLEVPPQGRALADTARSALAHILISRDGPALRPGTRAYARSWIRDGAMMSDALLRAGQARVAREYAEWFAAHQFSGGKVPCCVDARGADPVPENDSQGELMHLVASLHSFAADDAWVRRMWPHVSAASAYMDSQLAGERTAANLVDARRAFYGLLPPSISHEGYSDRPAYSYWDDFWALAGYAAAADIAPAAGRDQGPLVARYETLRGDVQASLRRSMQQHGIDYLPASADRGDFDPTATTIALSVARAQAELPQDALQRTFGRYWDELSRRRDDGENWSALTPYEIRNAGAFARLGWRERAMQALDYFLGYRRPAAWNQWPEVVGRDAREPRFIGDMPHAWIASDFMQAAFDLFAYERAVDRSLVLAAGIPAAWMSGAGVGIGRLRTPWGPLTYSLYENGGKLVLDIAGAGMGVPPGGFVFAWPHPGEPGQATLNGKPLPWESGRALRIRRLPARVEMALPNDPEPRIAVERTPER
ncbi:MAG TPA: discoidin domain-containing protein [Burkholderiales bacterium]|nr:discoidin domain-containing protein [Burkholderiales bacterium]